MKKYPLLYILNDATGTGIAKTNFWETHWTARNFAFVSYYRGCFRLLLPPALHSHVPEMRAAPAVVISRGPWMAGLKIDAMELLFDDGRCSPFAMHMGVDQTDTLPAFPAGPPYPAYQCSVYTTQDAIALELPAYMRYVSMLPYLKAWGA